MRLILLVLLFAGAATVVVGSSGCDRGSPDSPDSGDPSANGSYYEVKASFPGRGLRPEAGSDVRIGGIDVGTVAEVARQPGRSTVVATLRVDPEHAPISDDARALLRRKTLLGDETFVEITTSGTDQRGEGSPPKGGEEATIDGVIDRPLDDEMRREFRRFRREALDRFNGRN